MISIEDHALQSLNALHFGPALALSPRLYGSFNCIIYDHVSVHPEPLMSEGRPEVPCALFGPTCDGLGVSVGHADWDPKPQQICPTVLFVKKVKGCWLLFFPSMAHWIIPVDQSSAIYMGCNRVKVPPLAKWRLQGVFILLNNFRLWRDFGEAYDARSRGRRMDPLAQHGCLYLGCCLAEWGNSLRGGSLAKHFFFGWVWKSHILRPGAPNHWSIFWIPVRDSVV